MNTSYKIVLGGAFALFAAVVGYYLIFSGDSEDEQLASAPPPTVVGNSNQTPPPSQPRPTNPDNRRAALPPTNPVTPDRIITVDTGDDDTPDIRVQETPDNTNGGIPGLGSTYQTPTPPTTGQSTTTTTQGSGETTTTEQPRTVRSVPGQGDTETTETTGTETVAGTGTQTPRRVPETTGQQTTGQGGTTTTETGTQTPEVEPAPVRPLPRYPDRLTSQPTPTPPRTYTVAENDTLSSIASTVYGDVNYWTAISRANPTIDPKALQIGQVLILPTIEQAQSEPEQPTPVAPGQDQTYTVRSGDNLSRIAFRFYGDREAWGPIHARNRNQIGDNPNNIRVGMELIIPQPYSGAE